MEVPKLAAAVAVALLVMPLAEAVEAPLWHLRIPWFNFEAVADLPQHTAEERALRHTKKSQASALADAGGVGAGVAQGEGAGAIGTRQWADAEAVAKEEAGKARNEVAGPSEDLPVGTMPAPGVLVLPYSELANLIKTDRYQPAMALAVVVIGAFCAWDGPRVWQALFTVAAAIAAGTVACYEGTSWSLAPTSQAVLVAQAMATTALATWSGFEGTQVVLGAGLGTAGAYGAGGWARWLDVRLPGAAFTWYSVGAAGGVLVVTTWRKPLLAAMAPLLGGFLVATGGGMLLSRLLASLTDHGSLPGLPAPHMPWSAVAAALLGTCSAAMLAGHGACICGAVLLQTQRKEPRPLAVLCLVGFALLTAAAAAVSTECGHLDGPVRCPAWLQASIGEGWQWSIVGCAAWTAVTAAMAWRQFRLLEDWESNSFWRGFFGDSNSFGYFFNNVPFGVVPASGRYIGLPVSQTQTVADAANHPTTSSCSNSEIPPLETRRQLSGWQSSLGGR